MIVNDRVGGKDLAVTSCPLCNSGIVFDRVVEGTAYDFGTSGMLYKSDVVMYDRQTHSLWAQMEGRAIVGKLAGTRLPLLPANTIAYADFKATYPGGKVLSLETGHQRQYGLNPYRSYDQPDLDPFLLKGLPDRRRPPKERVVGATAVFSPTVAGKTLSFEPAADGFRDRETGSLWSLLGHAVRGPLAGKRLQAIPHVDAFWFAWAAFHPSTSIYEGP